MIKYNGQKYEMRCWCRHSQATGKQNPSFRESIHNDFQKWTLCRNEQHLLYLS